MRTLFSDPDGRVDLALAIFIWSLAATVYVAAARLPPPIFDPVGSAAIPKAVAIVLALLAAGILAQRLLRVREGSGVSEGAAEAGEAGEADEGGAAAALRPGVAAACIAIMIGYTAVMAFGALGFREATVPFVILLGGALSGFRRSTMLVLVPSALAIAIGFGWLFSEILYVDLPVTRWLQP